MCVLEYLVASDSSRYSCRAKFVVTIKHFTLPHLTFFCVSSELAMILSMAQTNPVMFGMVADTPGVSQQLERMGRLKELLETDQDELKEKQREDWIRWVSRYR